ncbi:MAG: hypothetical protein ACT4P1_13070 [Sporichthyaceae bacterium]
MRLLQRRDVRRHEGDESRDPFGTGRLTTDWLTPSTTAPGSFIDVAARIIEVPSVTEAARTGEPWIAEDLVEADPEPALGGSPEAALLLLAMRDVSTWLSMTQDQVCRYLGVSPSTVMAWKREPRVHPRHRRVPAVLRLWAALSGAREELGEEATARIVWTHRQGTDVLGVTPEELAETLLSAADESSLAGVDDDGYDPLSPVDLDRDDLARNELALSASLRDELGEHGGTDTQ